jgi:hypothetical protein
MTLRTWLPKRAGIKQFSAVRLLGLRCVMKPTGSPVFLAVSGSQTSAAAWILGSWVRIALRARVCCMLCIYFLCDELMARSEESYRPCVPKRLWSGDPNSRYPWPALVFRATERGIGGGGGGVMGKATPGRAFWRPFCVPLPGRLFLILRGLGIALRLPFKTRHLSRLW